MIQTVIFIKILAFARGTEAAEILPERGADPALKDKEGHTAKDFDYHPDADSEILDKEAKAEKIRDESQYEL